TRIKACLIDDAAQVLAQGSSDWENQLVDGHWTYALDDVWSGLRAAVAALLADHASRSDTRPVIGSLGVSAMMHGYLAFDRVGELLVPFRTWRDTTTSQACAVLTPLLDFAVPQRWSIAHLYQAVLDNEAHLPQIDYLTTLAGYVHWQLTGERVLGIGDASGMFPIDSATSDFDQARLDLVDGLIAGRGLPWRLRDILPTVRVAGQVAGRLTAQGAARIDPSGVLAAGTICAPPEGDAGTGMVATNAVAARSGNVSVGTSIFAMVVLADPLRGLHPQIDLVTTPVGDPVAMVHCNNGASELDVWAQLFADFGARMGGSADSARVFTTLFEAALEATADADGLLAYNYLSGEPVTQLDEGRPLLVRPASAALTLPNLMRALLMSSFASLALGMRVLAEEGVAIDRLYAHGGVFTTPVVAQRLLAAALNVPVAVSATAAQGGAWGMAVLARFAAEVQAAGTSSASCTGSDSAAAQTRASVQPISGWPAQPDSLATWLDQQIFVAPADPALDPRPEDVVGFRRYLARFVEGLPIEQSAVDHS
ncbi:MAG: ATPase, partial [Propionibacteriaceae bacterium]|nr:ATPase [Propionibacteriaceae bacterium]